MLRVMKFQAKQINLATVNFTPELLRCIPAATARLHRTLPVADQPSCLLIALADVQTLDVLDQLHFALARDIEVCVAEPHQLDTFLERLYPE
jgi:hypothetical protein